MAPYDIKAVFYVHATTVSQMSELQEHYGLSRGEVLRRALHTDFMVRALKSMNEPILCGYNKENTKFLLWQRLDLPDMRTESLQRMELSISAQMEDDISARDFDHPAYAIGLALHREHFLISMKQQGVNFYVSPDDVHVYDFNFN